MGQGRTVTILPERIREARKRAGLSQEILGLRVLKNASHAVSLWEQGKMGVAEEHIPALCIALDVTRGMLEGTEDIPSAIAEPYGLDLLRKTRRRLGLSVKAVAIAVGVSPSKMGEWERGDRKIPAARLERICEVLGVTPDMLVEPALVRSPSLEAEREASRCRCQEDPSRRGRLGQRTPYTHGPGQAP